MTEQGDPVDAASAAREAKRMAVHAARLAREQAKQEARRARAEIRRARQAFDDDDDDGERGPVVEQELPLTGARRVELHQSAGRVNIVACAAEETPRITSQSEKSPPRVEVERHGDRVRIDVQMNLGRIFRRRRGPRTTVYLPQGLDHLSIEVGHGHVVMDALECTTFVTQVGAGEFRAYGCTGDLDLNVAAGQAVVEGHRGLVTCDTGTGDARIAIAEPRDGSYRLNVGMGQAVLSLPPGHRVHTSVSSGIGKAEAGYPDAGADAPIQVRVNAGVGRAAVVSGQPQAERSQAGPQAKPQRSARATEAEEVRVLQMLEQGRITSQEAAELIAALRGVEPPENGSELL